MSFHKYQNKRWKHLVVIAYSSPECVAYLREEDKTPKEAVYASREEYKRLSGTDVVLYIDQVFASDTPIISVNPE